MGFGSLLLAEIPGPLGEGALDRTLLSWKSPALLLCGSVTPESPGEDLPCLSHCHPATLQGRHAPGSRASWCAPRRHHVRSWDCDRMSRWAFASIQDRVWVCVCRHVLHQAED